MARLEYMIHSFFLMTDIASKKFDLLHSSEEQLTSPFRTIPIKNIYGGKFNSDCHELINQ
jgi:hypothetical protein